MWLNAFLESSSVNKDDSCTDPEKNVEYVENVIIKGQIEVNTYQGANDIIGNTDAMYKLLCRIAV